MTPEPTRIDLRSDTVTLPTEEMYARMQSCPLGDDGLDGDPTAQALEAMAAHLLGKQAGLYVPTATMANLLAVLAQTARQERVLAEATSHLYLAEQGGAALSGAFYQGVPGREGAMDLAELSGILESARNRLRVGLVCMETSHNNAGGTVLPLPHMQAVHRAAKSHGAGVHVDGARLFNAAVALGLPAAELAACADTVAICLSKGLSAPMGAVLVGDEGVVARARTLRKALGGTQRQTGIAAAAGMVALASMTGRLADDHQSAHRLGDGIRAIAGLAANVPQTNIVQVDVAQTTLTASDWERELRARGVLARPWGPRLLRCVTHRHIQPAHVDAAVAVFRDVAASCAA